jgi:hypothetical protein
MAKNKLRHPADRERRGGRARIHVKKADEYNPESNLSETTISAHEHYKRMAVESKGLAAGKVEVRGRIAVVTAYKDGRMIEAQHTGKGWRLGFAKLSESRHHALKQGVLYKVDLVRVDSTEAFRKLTQRKDWAAAKLLETLGLDAFNYGGDDLTTGSIVGPPNDEYTPLLGGPFSKQLYIYDYLDMHAKAFWSKNHHPFGKAIVNILRSYVVGKGVKVLFASPAAQKCWDDFEKRTDFQAKLRTDVETLVWAGEIMTEKAFDTEGLPILKQIDPSTVWEIVTDPLTPEVALYFHQQYPTQWQLTYKPTDKNTEYIINDIPGDKVIHIKINNAPGEKRGRSDLFAVLSWLKRFRDYFNAKVVKAQMEESWGLDIAIDGDQADVDAYASNPDVQRIPPAGSTRIHNKDVEFSYLNPTSSSTQGRDNVGEQIKNVIAVGAGIAPEWLGESAAGSTAETARTKEGPASRNIEDKQMVIERYIRRIGEFVLDSDSTLPETQVRPASLSKLKLALVQRNWKSVIKEATALLLSKEVDEPIDKSFEIIFPEPAGEDRKAKLEAIVLGEAQKYLSHERAATMYAKEIGVTSYDPQEEAEAIQAESDMGGGNEEWNAGAGDDEEPEENEPTDPGKKSKPTPKSAVEARRKGRK